MSCNDIYGNEIDHEGVQMNGDYVGSIADQEGVSGNFSANPMFCDTSVSDYHLAVNSPCLTDSTGCGLIGARDIGCSCCRDRGNVDGDTLGVTDISDLVYFVDYIFLSGPQPPCAEEADLDVSGLLDIADVVFLVDYMFNGGPAPLPCAGALRIGESLSIEVR
jgi:hypothetical protein